MGRGKYSGLDGQNYVIRRVIEAWVFVASKPLIKLS